MEQLSSCYFCGAALDAQIEPYRVVPASLDPSDDEQRAVSLCPACRQKLAQIVDTVVAATDAADATGAVDDVPELDPEGGLLDDEPIDPAGTADENDAPAGSSDAPDGASGEPAPDREDGPDDTGASRNQTIERTRSSQTQGASEQSRGNERRQRNDRSGQAGDPLDSGSRDANGTEQRQSGREDRQYSSGQRAGQRDDDDRTHQSHGDDGAADADDDGPSLTALEYNKVMRLLQNREFPVERAEIHEVATSAYDISDREFDAIIDAAIQRGLIDEENGQLVGSD